LWVEGAPFNSGNGLWTNEGATFSPSSQPQGLTNTFTWEAWVKPDNNLSGDNTNENYVLYPWFDGANYSSTYAGLGIATGKDGIRLVGHTANYLQQIIELPLPTGPTLPLCFRIMWRLCWSMDRLKPVM
jgi:hypothetical protein